MSLTEDLLTILGSYHQGYSLMRRRMRGYQDHSFSRSVKEASGPTLRVVLSRLKKQGLVKNERGIWNITDKGKEYLKKKLFFRKHKKRVNASNKSKSRRLIVAFDIPEYKRRERDWLRIELKNLGFEMLQKSVWFGPAPLPKDFVITVKEFGILEFLKFFKAEEQEVVHGNK